MTPQTLDYLIRLTMADRHQQALLVMEDLDGPGTSPDLGAAILALRELLDLKQKP